MSERFSFRRAVHAATPLFVFFVLSTGAVATTTPGPGDVYANDGNYAAATQVFTAAHKQAPDNALFVAKLARLKLLQGKHKQAVDWAKKAQALAPDKAAYRMLLGDAYASYANDVSIFKKLGIAHRIRDNYRKAVELEPDNVRAHYSLAMFYLFAPGIAGGSEDKADAQVRVLAKLNPAMADMMRARKAARAKHMAQAEHWLREAAAKSSDARGYDALGLMLVSRSQPEKALAAFRQATKAYPKAPAAYYQIGKLAATGKIDPKIGIKALRIYLGLPIDWSDGDAPYAWAHYRLAQARKQLGQTDKARSECRQALHLKPGFKQAKKLLDELASS